MSGFRDYPISKKLIITFCVVAAVALVVSISSLAITSWLNERNRALTELKTTAELIGDNSTAALIFRDKQAASETLATLKALGYVMFAALYDKSGGEFARYIRDSDTEIITGGIPKEDRISGKYITVVQPVIHDDSGVGHVVLHATLEQRLDLLKYNMGITAGILIIASLIAMLFAIALGHSIADPLARLSTIMKRVSSDHNYSIRTNMKQADEIGILANGIDDMLARAEERDMALEQNRKELEEEVSRRTKALQEANENLKNELEIREEAEKSLQRAHRELEMHHHEFSLLSEMNDRLQVCHSVNETSPVVAHYIRKLFPGSSGGLYIYNSSRSLVEPIVLWGESTPKNEMFKQEDCWALRQGHKHLVNDPDDDLVCPHCLEDISGPYLCIPMIAYGDVMGVLHLRVNPESQSGAAQQMIPELNQLATTASEHLALAMANLKLREVLQMQSVRDPLTGLYNRRYMQETLEREIARCQRNNTMLGVIMLDIDFFKKFNDSYGHDVGDTVLHELGGFLMQEIRSEDIACRYGGEEFILIMPGIDLDIVSTRAEEIRNGVKNIQIMNKGEEVSGLSLSLGIAIYPLHGKSPDSLITAADGALYTAKRQGRDRYIVAEKNNLQNTEASQSRSAE
jgi:diguanylate cyclase (GGDEF)-like protein